MLRFRTGARDGIRWGVVGFAAAVALLTNQPVHAAPYADIVVDGNSSSVLHATNADSLRHPASLTKIMTLYLLFEQLEAGKLKLDSQLKVSSEAAGQMPTKLGLKPGSTLQVEDAIKGVVTRSANDAAVLIAEAIAGDEDEFAKLMTRKAQALGMTRTVYKNASGLPDDDQVTTARDQATLGRAVQERFPRYYKYFSIRSFNFRGQSIGNHNHLLGRVEGVDGIKTGYISASGFNLVTSVHRGNRYVVAVVMGGSSAGSRDARMRELISEKIALAATKRTAPMVAELDAPELKGAAQTEARTGIAKTESVAKTETAGRESAKTESKAQSKRVAKSEPKSDANSDAKNESPRRLALASITSVPAAAPSAAQAESLPQTALQFAPTAAPESRLVTIGSTDPIRPVLVKTLNVRAGTVTATAKPLLAASASPQEAALPAGSAVAAPKSEPATTAARNADPAPAPVSTVADAAPVAAKTSAAAAKPHARSGWVIQVGAYQAEQEAKQRLSALQSKASKVLSGADPFTETVDKGGTTYYRARFAGLDKEKAEAACKHLKRDGVECVTIKN
jgi:D-alanyl-D-alanine carboxypeptidase